MRGLLQNKLFVGCMSVLAVVLVGWRLKAFDRFLPAQSPAEVAAREVPQALTPLLSRQDTGGAPRAMSIRSHLTNGAALFPEERIRRDPFARVIRPEPAAAVVEAREPLPNVQDYTLQAIGVESGQSYAVINRRVYAAGETVGDFLVQRITLSEVWLKHVGGNKVLRLHRGQPSTRDPFIPYHQD